MDNQQTGAEPPQPERTAEQLRAIQAAMMEELGIGRLDTLPLEDKGHQGLIPLAHPVPCQVPTNSAIAAWHNVQFDDVDEAHGQLDSIAGGQLYRLRRDASAPSHDPSSRGGHHSSDNTVRGGRGGGGGSPARGGPARGSRVRASAAPGARGGHSGSTRSGRGGSSLGIGTHAMTSSRHGTNKQVRIENTLAMLRNASAVGRRLEAASVSNESRLPTSYHSTSLADPQAFFSHMGMNARAGNVPAPAQQADPSHGTATAPAPSQSAFSALGGSTQALTSSSSQQALLVVDEVAALTRAPTPTAATIGLNYGITSSMWAEQHIAGTSASQSYSTTSLGNSTAPVASDPTAPAPSHTAPAPQASLTGRRVLKEKPAKATRNGGREVQGKIRLVEELKSIILEFEAMNIIQLRAPLSEEVSFSITAFRFLVFSIGQDVFNFELRFPHQASEFEQLLPPHFAKISTSSEHVIPTLDSAGAENPAPFAMEPGQSLHPTVPAIDTSTQVEAPKSLSISETVRNLPVPVVETSTSAISQSLPDPPEEMNEGSVALFDPYDLSTLPVSRASDIENSGTLIDFSQEAPNDESTSPVASSAIHDLACMNNDSAVVGLLEMLNKGSAGESFFKSNQDMSAEELLSLVEDLTTAWLKIGREFRKLPKDQALVHVKDISKRAFEWARAEDPDFQTRENESTLKVEDLSSKVKDLSFGGEASVSGNNHSQQVEEFQPVVKPEEVDTHSASDHQKVRKYSIQEIIGLRDRSLTPNNKLVSHLRNIPPRHDSRSPRASTASKQSQRPVSRAESIHESVQSHPTPSRDEFASKFANPEYQVVFQGQGSSALKPATLNVAASSSTSQKPQPLPEVSSEAEISGNNQSSSESDSALHGSILATIKQDKSSDAKSKDLKIEASSQPQADGSTDPNSDLRHTESSPSKSVTQAGLTPSAPPFDPSHKASQVTTKDGENESTLLQKKILQTSNKKEDMERAKVPGLAMSCWSSAPAPVPRAVPTSHIQTYATSPSIPYAMPSAPQQFRPVVRTILIPDVNNAGSMQAVSGFEVVGQLPGVAQHKPLFPPTMGQENSGFQGFPQLQNVRPPPQPHRDLPTFPPRPTMSAHHTPNTSSTTSDTKFDKWPPESPADTARPPLSPRKANIQANFKESIHRSLADRRN